jgi:hypothetical protein
MSRTDHVTGQLAIAKTSNQLVLGTTNTTTLSFTAPSASRVYTFPDVGSSTNVQMGIAAVTTATIGGITTLTAADSGKTIFCGQAIANNSATVNVIILPAPSAAIAGFRAKVIFTTVGDNTAGHGWQITSTGANMSGHRYGIAAGIVGVNANGVTNLIRSGTAADTKVGDSVELHCDGTSYYYVALSAGVANPFSTS